MLQTHDEEYLWQNIRIVEESYKKGSIRNVKAYLMKGFKVGYRPTETEFEKEQKQKAVEEKQKREQTTQKLAEKREWEEQQKKEFEQLRNQEILN